MGIYCPTHHHRAREFYTLYYSPMSLTPTPLQVLLLTPHPNSCLGNSLPSAQQLLGLGTLSLVPTGAPIFKEKQRTRSEAAARPRQPRGLSAPGAFPGGGEPGPAPGADPPRSAMPAPATEASQTSSPGRCVLSLGRGSSGAAEVQTGSKPFKLPISNMQSQPPPKNTPNIPPSHLPACSPREHHIYHFGHLRNNRNEHFGIRFLFQRKVIYTYRTEQALESPSPTPRIQGVVTHSAPSSAISKDTTGISLDPLAWTEAISCGLCPPHCGS